MKKRKSLKIKNQAENHKIEGNKQVLVDLLVILLDNAIKYSPPKKLVTIDSKKTDGSLSVSIKDQGIGIDKKDIPFIFKRFYRSEINASPAPQYGC